MEDLIIRYDGTVRTAIGSIVQFLYGEDGMDATRIEKQYMEHLTLDVSCCCIITWLCWLYHGPHRRLDSVRSSAGQ
jgi:hypothetical protein